MGNIDEPWLDWAIELQSIAQIGITYTKDRYDKERYNKIREIASKMVSIKTNISSEIVTNIFCNETGYPTPKIDTRAAVFKDNKILLVQEKGKWSLPGGWVDVAESVYSNTIKEVKEESGCNVKPVKIIALHDRNKHNSPRYAYNICKIFVLCELIDLGYFKKNTETDKREFYDLDNLPELATEKNNQQQIEMCFQAKSSENWEVIFD